MQVSQQASTSLTFAATREERRPAAYPHERSAWQTVLFGRISGVDLAALSVQIAVQCSVCHVSVRAKLRRLSFATKVGDESRSVVTNLTQAAQHLHPPPLNDALKARFAKNHVLLRCELPCPGVDDAHI